jgi:hypothetical protein
MYKEPIINVNEKPSTGKYVTSLNCELVSNQDVSFLEGKIKTLIESFGMRENQEKSAKDMAQMVLWDWYCFIRDHRTGHLIEKKNWYRENTTGINTEVGSGVIEE